MCVNYLQSYVKVTKKKMWNAYDAWQVYNNSLDVQLQDYTGSVAEVYVENMVSPTMVCSRVHSKSIKEDKIRTTNISVAPIAGTSDFLIKCWGKHSTELVDVSHGFKWSCIQMAIILNTVYK